MLNSEITQIMLESGIPREKRYLYYVRIRDKWRDRDTYIMLESGITRETG